MLALTLWHIYRVPDQPAMTNQQQIYPILWSFRRCPYAMRARLAILVSGLKVELREIVLREKAPEFLASSPKGTVPVLVTPSAVIDESLELMLWALNRSDSESWLAMSEEGYEWITRCDGPFKTALDHTKYAVRYPDLDPEQERGRAAEFLSDLNLQIAGSDLDVWRNMYPGRYGNCAIYTSICQ